MLLRFLSENTDNQKSRLHIAEDGIFLRSKSPYRTPKNIGMALCNSIVVSGNKKQMCQMYCFRWQFIWHIAFFQSLSSLALSSD